MVPAEGESTADELPMPSHGLVTPDLILRPAQSVLHLLVALLDPHSQPIQAHHFLHTGRCELIILSALRSWSG
jgi:hypothetical protein